MLRMARGMSGTAEHEDGDEKDSSVIISGLLQSTVLQQERTAASNQKVWDSSGHESIRVESGHIYQEQEKNNVTESFTED